jgi:hypothetical protein
MKTETIHWHELPADGMPDAEITVLAEITQPQGGTEVWPAFWSGERWIDCSLGWPIEPGRVVAWADQPAGVSAC